MNTELILKIADALEKSTTNGLPVEGLGFNMAAYYARSGQDRTGHRCRTVACIAGWTIAMSSDAKDRRRALARVDLSWAVVANAADLLALGYSKANDLFHPAGVTAAWSDITPSQAASVLRHLAATGEVDWSIIDQAPAPERRDG